MPGPSGESCRDCYFLQVIDAESEEGLCRRYPQKYMQTFEFGSASEQTFQIEANIYDFDDDWCGEFKPLKPEGE